MCRITGGKVYDPANGVEGVVKDICIADDGRVVANDRRRQHDDRRDRHVDLPGRRGRSHARRRRRAQLRPRAGPRKSARRPEVHALAGAPGRHRRH